VTQHTIDRGLTEPGKGLFLRPTGLSSPAYRDWADYTVTENGRAIGRIYEDRHSRPELRWFWSIAIFVNPMLGIVTNGRTATIKQAKEQFRNSWERVRASQM
jgi:hypothetical protein